MNDDQADWLVSVAIEANGGSFDLLCGVEQKATRIVVAVDVSSDSNLADLREEFSFVTNDLAAARRWLREVPLSVRIAVAVADVDRASKLENEGERFAASLRAADRVVELAREWVRSATIEIQAGEVNE